MLQADVDYIRGMDRKGRERQKGEERVKGKERGNERRHDKKREGEICIYTADFKPGCQINQINFCGYCCNIGKVAGKL